MQGETYSKGMDRSRDRGGAQVPDCPRLQEDVGVSAMRSERVLHRLWAREKK